MQINVNGFIAFDSPIVDWYPELFPRWNRKMIAPFWADIDLSCQGIVYYGYHRSVSASLSGANANDAVVIAAAIQLIKRTVADAGFFPTSIYKITWTDVSPYPCSVNATQVCA